MHCLHRLMCSEGEGVSRLVSTGDHMINSPRQELLQTLAYYIKFMWRRTFEVNHQFPMFLRKHPGEPQSDSSKEFVAVVRLVAKYLVPQAGAFLLGELLLNILWGNLGKEGECLFRREITAKNKAPVYSSPKRIDVSGIFYCEFYVPGEKVVGCELFTLHFLPYLNRFHLIHQQPIKVVLGEHRNDLCCRTWWLVSFSVLLLLQATGDISQSENHSLLHFGRIMQDRLSSYACVRHLLLTDPPFPARPQRRHIVVQPPRCSEPYSHPGRESPTYGIPVFSWHL